MTCRRIDREAENRPKRPPEARKSDKNTANTQQVRFFKLYFHFNVFSAENRRLFLIEFQLHTNSHITLWLPVPKQPLKGLSNANNF